MLGGLSKGNKALRRITAMVPAAVLIYGIAGPLSTKMALKRSGETKPERDNVEFVEDATSR